MLIEEREVEDVATKPEERAAGDVLAEAAGDVLAEAKEIIEEAIEEAHEGRVEDEGEGERRKDASSEPLILPEESGLVEDSLKEDGSLVTMMEI